MVVQIALTIIAFDISIREWSSEREKQKLSGELNNEAFVVRWSNIARDLCATFMRSDWTWGSEADREKNRLELILKAIAVSAA